ncbi:MAG: hypothetical protein U0S48_14120 [Solirubrobacteraceae bacterium]
MSMIRAADARRSHHSAALAWLSTAPGPHARTAARSGPRVEVRLSQRVDRSVQRDEATTAQPMVDRGDAQRELEELASGDHPVLARGECGDPAFDVAMVSHADLRPPDAPVRPRGASTAYFAVDATRSATGCGTGRRAESPKMRYIPTI